MILCFKIICSSLLLSLCLPTAGLAVAEMATVTMNPVYRKTELVAVPWGAKPGKFGLMVPPDGEMVGPRTFTVDAAGTIYILDTFKKNIKIFDHEGRFQASVGKNLLGYALACHEGFLYLLDGDALRKYSLKGNLVQTYAISDRIELREGYGQWLRVTEDGSLYVKSGRKAYRILASLDQDILSAELQERSERRGSPNRQGSLWFSIVRQTPQRQLLQVTDFGGNLLFEIPLETDQTFGANYFLDEDHDGNLYLEIQTVDADDKTRLEVRRYDRTGQLQLTIPLVNRYHTGVFKKLLVTADGELYQMRTEPSGVFVDKWEQKKKP